MDKNTLYVFHRPVSIMKDNIWFLGVVTLLRKSKTSIDGVPQSEIEHVVLRVDVENRFNGNNEQLRGLRSRNILVCVRVEGGTRTVPTFLPMPIVPWKFSFELCRSMVHRGGGH